MSRVTRRIQPSTGSSPHAPRRRRRGDLVERLGCVLVVAIVVLALSGGGAEGRDEARVLQGQAVFGQRCTACHTIGRGVLVGPDLQGVTERREATWLRVHIQSPSVHHAQDDPLARANREKFRMRMPDLGLSEQEVEAAIAYLQVAARAPVATPAFYAPTLVASLLGIAGLTLLGLRAGRKRVEVRP